MVIPDKAPPMTSIDELLLESTVRRRSFFIKIFNHPTLTHCFSIQATTALAETTAIADFKSLTVFSAIAVVTCTAVQTKICSNSRKTLRNRKFECKSCESNRKLATYYQRSLHMQIGWQLT